MRTFVTAIGVLAMVGCENTVSIGAGARGLPDGVPPRPSQEDLARMATTFSGGANAAAPPSDPADAQALLDRQNADASARGEQTEEARATIARARATIARNAELLGAANGEALQSPDVQD